MLRENDIRPERLKEKQVYHIQYDIQWLADHAWDYVDVACPACDKEERVEIFRKTPFSYALCKVCKTIYVCPRPSTSLLETFYSISKNYEYWNDHIFPASEDARRKNIFRPRAEKIQDIYNRFSSPSKVLLEVGAGFGTFCEEIHSLEIFDRIIGVEPTPSLAETCRQKGIEIIALPFEKLSFEEKKVSVITAFEVVEHLFAPKLFMEKAIHILAPGGLMVLTCPNIHGFETLTLGIESPAVDHEHLNYFNPESISNLAQSVGFEVLEVTTPGELDVELVRKAHLDGRIDLSESPFLKHIIIDKWSLVASFFQKFLAENGLSSHMWLVAKKP